MEPTDLLTIGEVARRSGFPPSALRYYEHEVLLRTTRTSGGQRRYERAVLRRLDEQIEALGGGRAAAARAAAHAGRGPPTGPLGRAQSAWLSPMQVTMPTDGPAFSSPPACHTRTLGSR